MDDIRQWLKGKQDYDAGAKLYIIHGHNHALRRVFREPASPFKKKLLIRELTNLLRKKTDTVKKIEVAEIKATENLTISDRRWPLQMDETTKALHIKWKPIFAEMMNLCSRIYDVALQGKTDPAMKQEAGRMAHRILDLDDECDAIYAQRDHYIRYGKLPDDKKPMELVTDLKKIPLALSNARRYIRDYKNKLAKDPGNVHAAEKIKIYEWAKAEYEKILNLDQ